jgi:hypothetical protein
MSFYRNITILCSKMSCVTRAKYLEKVHSKYVFTCPARRSGEGVNFVEG